MRQAQAGGLVRARAIIKTERSIVASGLFRLTAALLVGAAALAVFGRTAPEAHALETMRSFHAVYEVTPEGEVRVTETITWDFGDEQGKHGIFRDIAVQGDCPDADDVPQLSAEETPLYPCPGGWQRLWPINDIDVEAAAEGEPLAVERYTSTRTGDMNQLKIGKAEVEVSGVRVYRIQYVLERSLDPYPEHDELYWDVTGRWPVTILEATAEVRLPPGAEARARCFEGRPGDDTECAASIDETGTIISYATNSWLGPGEEMTIVAGWQKGLVEVPTPLFRELPEKQKYFTGDAAEVGGAAALGVVSLAGVGMLWWHNGRDRRYRSIYYLTQDPTEHRRPLFGDDNVVVEFLPPDDLKPAQMGVILDERADPLDVTATIIDLAVNGYLHITEVKEKGALGGLLGGKTDWMLSRKRTDTEALQPFEKEIMDGLFEGGEQVQLSDLRNKFYKHLDDAQDDLYRDAMKRKWFPRKPGTTKAIWAGIGIAIAAAGAGLSFLFGLAFERAAIGFGLALAGIVLLLMAPSMPRRTATGSEALRRVLGFRLYVATAEKYQHEFNERENIFARYLPYAIVFGCVNKWAKAFEGLDDRISRETAAWYSGASAFHVASFSSSLQGLSSSVTSTVQSSPSSSGSGFSGGGGAGGGGGGGGGGSW
jgi:hypothetical protein